MSRTAYLVGRFLVDKARNDRQARGTQAVARQLRKQGIPLWVALKALGIRPLDSVPPAAGEPPRH